MSKSKIAAAFLGLIISVSVHAQVFNSPFSRQGIGELQHAELIRYQGMGGASVAFSEKNYFNLSNPASYSQMTSFDFETALRSKYYTLSSTVDKFSNLDLNLPYLVLAFPIDSSRQIGFSGGLVPFARTGYKLGSRSPGALTATDTFMGQGSFSQFYIGSSVAIFKDLLFIGVDAAYLFGNRNTTQVTFFTDDPYADVIQSQKLNLSGLVFDAGLLLTPQFKNGNRLQLGFKMDLGRNLNAKRQYFAYTSLAAFVDTIVNTRTSEGKVFLPNGYTAGINFNNNRNWNIELDASFRPWSQMTIFGNNAGLNDLMGIALGGEWVPINNSTSSPLYTSAGNYIRRIRYRMGLSMANTPYSFGNTNVSDRSISLGFGFPVMKKGKMIDEASMIDVTFRAGKLGNVNTTQIQEDYLMLSVGLHLFESDWFMARKIE